jgi:ribosomal protein S18 acetylase RimI-like enzyme
MENLRIRSGNSEDCSAVLELIKELAVFEKAGNEVILTREQLESDAFGPKPIVEIFIAEYNQDIAGAALIYEKYSTWKGRSVHLEDLIVKEKYRGLGIGSALFEYIIQLSKSRNYGRMEWQVLDWNDKAIKFYEKYGSHFLEEWLDCRLTSSQIQNFNK